MVAMSLDMNGLAMIPKHDDQLNSLPSPTAPSTLSKRPFRVIFVGTLLGVFTFYRFSTFYNVSIQEELGIPIEYPLGLRHFVTLFLWILLVAIIYEFKAPNKSGLFLSAIWLAFLGSMVVTAALFFALVIGQGVVNGMLH